MCRFSGATFFCFTKLCEILILDVIAALNWFPWCEKPLCNHQKPISTLFGSKVKTHYVAVAAILAFAL